MKRVSPFAVMATVSAVVLLASYFIIYTFYAAGLFPSGLPSARVLERTLRATIVTGPFLAGFLLLGALAWHERWTTGILPWVVGALGVAIVSRYDAGILTAYDAIWVAVFLTMAIVSKRDDDTEPPAP